MGVTLTVTGADGTALAAAVAAAINASTTAVSSTVSLTTPQLRDLCYARSSGAVLEVMTRAGGPQLNFSTNSAVTITTAGMTGTPAITQFSGGASGAWSTLWNTAAAVLPSAKATGSYGCLTANLAAGGRLLLTPRLLTATDYVWVRARNQGLTLTTSSFATVYNPFNMVVDANNEKWGDTLGKVVTIGHIVGGSENGCSLQARANFAAPMHMTFASNAKWGLVFRSASTNGNTASNSHVNYLNPQGGNWQNGRVLYENVLFADDTAYAYNLMLYFDAAPSSASVMYRGCKRRATRNGNIGAMMSIVWNLQGYTNTMLVDDCDFDYPNLSGSGAVQGAMGSNFTRWTFKITNSRAYTAGGSFYPVSGSHPGMFVRAENLQGFTPAASGMFGSANVGADAGSVAQFSVGGQTQARFETAAVLAEWVPGSGFPTYRAFFDDGTYWSWRLTWSGDREKLPFDTEIDQLSFTKKSLSSTAVREIQMELLVDPSQSTVHDRQIVMRVSYIDNTDVRRTEVTCGAMEFLKTPVALPASAAGWTKNSYGAFVARRLSLTTQYPVKANTNVTGTLAFAGPATSTCNIFVDPELEIV